MFTHGSASEVNLQSLIIEQFDIFAKICRISKINSTLKNSLLLLTNESLDQQVNSTYPGLSQINANGFPFQWSLSLENKMPSLRFLCESGYPGTSVAKRINLSFQKILELLDLMSYEYPTWLFTDVKNNLIPKKIPDSWLSAVWFAIGANDNGILPKIYFNLNNDSILNRWKSIGWVLKDLGRNQSLDFFCKISSVVSNGSLPIGIAFDILPSGQAGRIKIYFRSLNANLEFLERWYESCNGYSHAELLRNFLDCFPCEGKYPYDSFTVGLEFPIENCKNWNPTLKIDLGVTKWMKGDYQISKGICRALQMMNIQTNTYEDFVEKLGPAEINKEKSIFHRFVGFGYEPDGSYHLNIYFEPFVNENVGLDRWKSSNSVKSITKSISEGILFLIRSQKENGSWVDFNLPVGASDVWVTSYVLYQLSRIQNKFRSDLLNDCIRKALNWLDMTQKKTGGWSYNSVVGEDSDSTSLAILAINGLGRPLKKISRERLLSYVQKDGGVSTYLKDVEHGDWTTSHCDVTPLALIALKELLSEHDFQKSLDFFSKNQKQNGLWPSYWWVTPLYATYFTLLWFQNNNYDVPNKKTLIQTLIHFNSSGTFETALYLNCMSMLEQKTNFKYYDSMILLLNSQLPDGSWPSSPILRVSHQDVNNPWTKIDSGTIYGDVKNILTTSTVVESLVQSLTI